VRRSVLARASVPGVVVARRMGVLSSLAGPSSGVWYWTETGWALRCCARSGVGGGGGVVRGASGKACSVGPHEKPMKKDPGASSRRMEREVVRRTERPGEPLLPSSDGWKKAEKANGAEVVEGEDEGSWTGSGRRAGAPERSSLYVKSGRWRPGKCRSARTREESALGYFWACHTGMEGLPHGAIEERVLHNLLGSISAEASLRVRK